MKDSHHYNHELSIWEVAHRMCAVPIGPSDTATAEVRDTIRWIVWGIESQQITAVDYRIEETGNHYEDLPNFWFEFREGRFNRELLDYVFLLGDNFVDYCSASGREPPEVWKGTSEGHDQKTVRMRPRQLRHRDEDKISCRTIAQILWSQDPKMTIADIGRHEWIIKYGNARHYSGRDTLRNWIKDLNPKPVGQRRGRPPGKK